MRSYFIIEIFLLIETLRISFVLLSISGYYHLANAMDTIIRNNDTAAAAAEAAATSTTNSIAIESSSHINNIRNITTSRGYQLFNELNNVDIDDATTKKDMMMHPLPFQNVSKTKNNQLISRTTISTVLLPNSSNSTTNNIAITSTATPPTLLVRSQKLALKSTQTTIASGIRTSLNSINSTSKITGASGSSNSKLTLPKPQKTDAPMLNYIFDMFSTANKHHHHDLRYGPHFEDIPREGNPTNITVQAGGSVYLNCRISLLQDKTVSWVRRNSMGEDALDLLTVGLHTYTGDSRYTMEFQYPNNWRLKISNARKEDEATYECQISTHPPRVIQINLHVNAPKVMIVDEYGDQLAEKYYETDSTLQLSCIVRNVLMTSSVVFWKHGDQILNYDTTRGGVSVKTDLMEDGANSTLFIAKINKSDSGNYTCSISDSQEYIIVVHILKGESFAELHHGRGSYSTINSNLIAIYLIFMLCLFYLPPFHVHR